MVMSEAKTKETNNGQTAGREMDHLRNGTVVGDGKKQKKRSNLTLFTCSPVGFP